MAKSKVQKVMGEYKRGTLHSGSKKGPKVSSRKQAVAIALSEQRRAKARGKRGKCMKSAMMQQPAAKKTAAKKVTPAAKKAAMAKMAKKRGR
jgi:hypothetical protein